MLVYILSLQYLLHTYTGDGGAMGNTLPRPAIVKGENAVEQALSEGYYPVLNRDIDVFAFKSSSGTCIYPIYMYVYITLH